jgi:hypothetical protein
MPDFFSPYVRCARVLVSPYNIVLHHPLAPIAMDDNGMSQRQGEATMSEYLLILTYCNPKIPLLTSSLFFNY